MLYGEQDVQTLQKAKFHYSVRVADLAERVQAQRRADRRYSAAQAGGSALPSGRTSYRHLADYELELKLLAGRYPNLVKPLTLNHKTHEGRDVVGIEIATHPYNLNDGKPIFANMGTHHAREWPAAESTLEWAYDLLTNYGNQARTTRLVRATRNIVIPVVNPDGFNISREAVDFPPETEFGQFSYEMKRKNCWPNPAATGPCNNSTGPAARRRPEPQLRRVLGRLGRQRRPARRHVPRHRSVLGAGDAEHPRAAVHAVDHQPDHQPHVLEPGAAAAGRGRRRTAARGAAAEGPRRADDEPQRLLEHPSYGLYDTTGSTEDWTFWAAGSLGYTFEIGDVDFHPPYEEGVVAEYLGLGAAAGAGLGGNREAYYEMLEVDRQRPRSLADQGQGAEGLDAEDPQELHDVHLAGLAGRFRHRDRSAQLFPDVLDYEYAPKGGRFEWNVNPSTRPVVAGRDGRDPGAAAGGHHVRQPAREPAENTEGNYADGAVRGDPVHGRRPARCGQRAA